MSLLDSSDFEAIRAKMNFPSGAARFLPDTKFILLGDIPRAEAWVTSQTDDTGEHAKEAARAYAAYLMLPKCWGELFAAYNAIGGTPPFSSVRQARDALLTEAMDEIEAITGTPEAPEPVRVEGTVTVAVSPRF